MEGVGSGGGGCCIARYTHTHTHTHTHHHNPNNTTNTNYLNYNYATYYNDDMSKMDRIMLRFRPIAPKPATFSATKPATSNDNGKANVTKRKRKNTNSSGSTRMRKSRSPDHRKSDGDESCHVVTLPLLPETPDLSPRENAYGSCRVGGHKNRNKSAATWLCFGASDEDQRVVESRVMVEGVTDTWVEGNGLGGTDEEKMRRLEEDTCPGFITDRWKRVWWTNEAYRRMVVEEETWRKEKVVVKVGMREKVDEVMRGYGGFTCRVRVEYGRHKMMTVPCDVWRMDGGGFAWRLDLKAALSLSL